jgi:N-acetylglucosaminyldiphosphoundecaprenol N-acetyl-beta-D-mannosaminyltransferase
MIMEGQRSPEFLSILREMNLNCPDGKPLFWVGKLQFKNLSQVCGPDFMQAFCEETSRTDFQHFFYGGGPGVAEGVVSELKSRHPTLQIAGFYEPPFRPLSPREDIAVVKQINESGADIVWVCLGCPKQELWMYKHRHVLPGKVILAVGQAFDIVAGVKRRAPAPIRAIGLEWLYRLAHEPKRLFGRYAKTNSAFLVFVILDFLNLRKRRS